VGGIGRGGEGEGDGGGEKGGLLSAEGSVGFVDIVSGRMCKKKNKKKKN